MFYTMLYRRTNTKTRSYYRKENAASQRLASYIFLKC